MSVKQTGVCPKQFSGLPQQDRFTFYSLEDGAGQYGVAALADAGQDMLELHLEMTRWGARARNGLKRDLEWLKCYARENGKSRILGMKSEHGTKPDPLWPRFTSMYGFEDHSVVQFAFLETEP